MGTNTDENGSPDAVQATVSVRSVSPSVRVNVAWTAAATCFNALCAWGTLMILARVGAPEVVGMFVLAVSIVTPIIAFSNLQLRENLATDAAGTRPFRDYLSLRLVTSAIAAIVIAVVGSTLVASTTGWGVLFGVAGAKLVESVSDIIYGKLQRQEQLKIVARFTMLRSGLSFTTFAVAILVTKNIVIASIASATCSLALLSWLEFPFGSTKPSMPAIFGQSSGAEVSAIWPLAWSSLPLGAITLMNSLAIHSPRYMIAECVGMADVAAYGVIHSTLSAFYLIQSAVGGAAMPRLARYYSERRVRQFLSLAFGVLSLGIGVSSGIILTVSMTGSKIISVIYGSRYADYDKIFLWMSVGSGLTCMYAAFSYFLHTMRDFKTSAWIAVANAVCVTGLGAYLIPTQGLFGAIWATMIATAICLVVAGVVFAVRIRRARAIAGSAH